MAVFSASRCAYTLAIALWLVARSAWGIDPVYSPNGIAIKGFDPVAYFVEQKPIRGDSTITFEWMGTIWYFTNEANRDAFAQDPERYAPQYGGYCAFGVSSGYGSSVDPKAWTVYNDKLYLNYSRSVRTKWLKDIDANITQADKEWPRLKNE